MKLLIIAAGEGSRLRQEGLLTPKPLIQIQGKPLVERWIDMAINHSISEVCIIVNDIYPELKTYFYSNSFSIPIHLVVKTTPSSLHSFYELRHFVKNESFILTTVDPVFSEESFASYLHHISQLPKTDGMMAVTSYVDDEKPLWVLTDSKMKIIAYQSVQENAHYISAGIYHFNSSIIPLLEEAILMNMHKMRTFQQFLVDRGRDLQAFDLGKVIDIDHVNDISSAEHFLLESS